MSLRTDQIFVRTDDQEKVAETLRAYVATKSKEFVPHSRFRLDGVQQVLANLVRKTRQFRLFTENDWTVIWEVVDHAEFADPAVARYLAAALQAKTIWITFDSDFDIWAFQMYDQSELVKEEFTPDHYFLGKPQPADKSDISSCYERAERFDAKLHLPAFLVSLPNLERNAKKYRNVKTVVYKLPRAESV